MKRAPKNVRVEMRLGRDQLLNEMANALIPTEMQTPKMKKLVDKAIKAATELDGALTKIDNLTEEDALTIREKLKSAPFELRRILLNASKKLRHDPGGRKKIVPDKERGMVVAAVAQLLLEGHELKTAKEIVARRRAVSVSTIQRIWKQRASTTKSHRTKT